MEQLEKLIYTISFAFASPNARCDDIVWIRPGHSALIGNNVCKIPVRKLMLDSSEKKGSRHPYYFVDTCIFLVQTYEIAWIACLRVRNSMDFKKAERPKASFGHDAHVLYAAIHPWSKQQKRHPKVPFLLKHIAYAKHRCECPSANCPAPRCETPHGSPRTSAGDFTPWYTAHYRNRDRRRRPRRALRQRKRRSR